MTFSFASGPGRSPWLTSGWSWSESWGVWSDGAAATFRLPRLLAAPGPLSLVFEVDAFLAPEHGLKAQIIDVSANGVAISSFRLTEGRARVEVTIPAAVIARRAGDPVLRFDLPTAASPSSLGVATDARRLGIGLRSLTIGSAP